MMKGRVLITGASGAIGSKLLCHLTEHNYQVRAFVRDSTSAKRLPKCVDVIQGDITDERALRVAVTNVDYVFHLAAKLHINKPAPALRDEYEQINVEGTRRLVEVAHDSAVKKLVFFSTINVYGASERNEVFDESSPLRLDPLYAETKVRGEEIVMTQMPTRSVVLRLAAVYGKGMKGNYPRLLNALRRGRFAMIGDGSNRRTLVYINDVCAASLLAAQQEAATGQIYNVTDGSIHTLREIINSMSAALGRRPPPLSLPRRPVRLLAGMIEDVLGVFGKGSPVGRATIDKFVEDVAVSGDRAQRELGFRPQWDLTRSWRETVGEMSDERFV